MVLAIVQTSVAQNSATENLQLDLKKPTVVVKGKTKDSSFVIKGQTPL